MVIGVKRVGRFGAVVSFRVVGLGKTWRWAERKEKKRGLVRSNLVSYTKNSVAYVIFKLTHYFICLFNQVQSTSFCLTLTFKNRHAHKWQFIAQS